MSTANQLMTAEQLWTMPHNGLRHELIKGELKTMPPSGGEHGVVGVNLTLPLALHVKTNQLGLVFGAETGFILARNPDTVLAPDIAFVRREKNPDQRYSQGLLAGSPGLGSGGHVSRRHSV